MYLISVVVLYFIIAKLFIDWSRWKEFYPTVQFYIICNLLYNFIFYHHSLWKYHSITFPWLKHTIIDLTFTFGIYPVVIMLFLQYFPNQRSMKFLYIAAWVLYYILLEFFFEKKGLFVHENGWNLWWSTLFNLISFCILRLHHRNQLVAILLSIPIITILLFFFHPTLQQLK
ncbi:CBO0543 family protein [Sutcliffiella deserti]|uniref:CBO0543 family protein n=1 Tax=Sutcliffiella deserti TaxID=2875501 RepID=UPI001CBD0324|nr:CBO0543 family protein [Sutcliffiella deserti]